MHGYTEGCKGCEHKRAGLDAQRPHNQACRSRIEAAIEQDARGRAARARTDNRFQQWERAEKERADEAKKEKAKEDVPEPVVEQNEAEVSANSQDTQNNGGVGKEGGPPPPYAPRKGDNGGVGKEGGPPPHTCAFALDTPSQ